MSSLEQLRENVIVAARKANEYDKYIYGDPVDHTAHDSARELDRAIAALDDSLKPDPWQLLEAAIFDWKNMNKVTGSTIDAMLKALEWRRTND